MNWQTNGKVYRNRRDSLPFRNGGVISDPAEMLEFRDMFSENDDEGAVAAFSHMENRRCYSEPQFDRNPHYCRQLKDVPEGQMHEVLREALDYFTVDGFDGMPLPPTGLPGRLHKKVGIDDPECSLILIGYNYFLAAARGQSRAMHNRWDDASKFIRRIEDAAREKAYREIAAQQASFGRGEQRKLEQSVYFIGSESGPIKIGMAVDPDSRCRTLQTSHHEKLEVLATCPGGQPKEREYHLRFAAHRLNGEWFEPAPAILAEIESLAA